MTLDHLLAGINS